MSAAAFRAAALSRGLARPSLRRLLPLTLASATVLAQIVYPLVQDGPWAAARDRLTMTTVTLFFLATVSAALVARGPAFTAALVAVTAGGGLLAESVGVRTGVPFGTYAYAGALDPKILGVPWVIPLAWTMMAYPALVVARTVTDHAVGGPLLAAAALATWDLFLDPQMVDAGYWTWQGGGPALLGIPLTNFAGWAATALVMASLLWPLLQAASPAGVDDRLPIALYLWTYAGSVIAHGLFLGLVGSALAGGIGMGVVVALLLRALLRSPVSARP